jgi:hypothetical protein
MCINFNLVLTKCACSEAWERPELRSRGFNSIFKGCLDPRALGIAPENEISGAVVIATKTPKMILWSALLKH